MPCVSSQRHSYASSRHLIIIISSSHRRSRPSSKTPQSVAEVQLELEINLKSRIRHRHFLTIGHHIRQLALQIWTCLLHEIWWCRVVQRRRFRAHRGRLDLAVRSLAQKHKRSRSAHKTYASGKSRNVSMKSSSVHLLSTCKGLARLPQTGQSSFF